MERNSQIIFSSLQNKNREVKKYSKWQSIKKIFKLHSYSNNVFKNYSILQVSENTISHKVSNLVEYTLIGQQLMNELQPKEYYTLSTMQCSYPLPEVDNVNKLTLIIDLQFLSYHFPDTLSKEYGTTEQLVRDYCTS